MLFNTVTKSMLVAFVGASVCACAGPSGGLPGYSGSNAVALATPFEAPLKHDAAERDNVVRVDAEKIPNPSEIFDFHPPGSSPGSWREPFVVSYTEGPLNAYRVKTLAELQALKDHKYDLVPPTALAAR